MKRFHLTPAIIFVMASGLFVQAACNHSKDNKNQDTSAVEINTNDEGQQKVQDFKTTWNQKMDQLNEKINEWENEAKTFKGEKKEQAQVKIDSLKAKKKRLNKKIDQAGDHVNTNWNKFKQDVSDSYDTLTTDVGNAFK